MKSILLVVVALIALFSSVKSVAVEPIDAGIFSEESTLVEVTGMTPTWGSIYGNELIVITGCHFSTYSEVTCMFDQWASLNAMIVSDTEIHCWTPTNVEFRTVPKTTELYLLFDGTRARSEMAVGGFHWGPYIETVTPTQDYVAGGSTLTIEGFGFGDYSSVKVLLDDAECTGASIGSDRITCEIPEGTFNQNAIIDVYFDDNQYYFLHSYWSLHYGPILESIHPTCGRVHGGDTVTMTGSLFDDDSLASPRVEIFLQDIGEWLVLPASRSGSSVTFTTPVGAIFDEDAVIELFGNPDTGSRRAEFSKVPGVASFHFGPLVYDVTPTVAYVLADSITITGCAFYNYTEEDFDITIGGDDVCETITVGNAQSDNSAKVVCTTGPHDCDLDDLVVNVVVPYEAGTRNVPGANEETFSVWWGPYVFDNTLTPTRGAILGDDPVTLTGIKLARGATTAFADPVCDWVLSDGGAATDTDANVNNAQTTVTCNNPEHVFHGTGDVNIVFGEECTANTPERQRYTYGPFCDQVSPTFGYIGGGTSVTLSGRGFTDKDWTNRKMQVRFCTRYPGEDCVWESDAANGQNNKPSSEQLVATTPNFALAPRNGIGGNRVFGEEATVIVYFGVEVTASNETDFDICDNTFRWGPIVEDINPKKGPMGPRGEESPGTSVTITGAGFNDPLVRENIRVSFGELHGFEATTNSDSQITVQTLWGGESNTNHDVFVYFDTCNTTESEEVWTWGPVITEVTPQYGYNMGANNDRTTVVTIYGDRFEDPTWCTESADTVWDCDVECYIDSTHSGRATPVEDEDGTIHFECDVPDKPFGTRAEVELRFSYNPDGSDYDNDCVSSEYNYNQYVRADEEMDIFYRPEITGIEPSIGEVHGGQTITISGYGLGNWDNIRCFVGEYEGTVQNKAALIANDANIDQDVECVAPIRRYDWGQDAVVSVFLGVSSEVDVEDQVEWHEKVWSPELFHFGPWCDISSDSAHGPEPSVGAIFPEETDEVLIRGIFWPDDEYYTDSTPIVQWVTQSGQAVNVTVEDDTDTVIRVSGIPRATACRQVDTVQIWWEHPDQMISCGTYMRYPIVDDEPEPELGWLGTRVTVSGVGFTDPEIYQNDENVKVTINNKAGYDYIVHDNAVEFAAPSNPWNTWQSVVISWASATGFATNESCTVPLAEKFHYGPIIEHVNPTYGFVEGDQTYTIIGRGFTCCGLQDTETICRQDGNDDPDGVDATGTISYTTVECTSFRTETTLTAANFEKDVSVGLKFNNSNSLVLDADDNGEDVVYHFGPFFDYVSPSHGTIEGDFTITIHGAGFDDPFFETADIMCVFSIDDEETQSDTVTHTAIVCNTPEHMRVCSDVDTVQASIPLKTTPTVSEVIRPLSTVENIEDFSHYYGPRIASIEPTWGYVAGNEPVTITFEPDLTDFPGAEFRVVFAHIELQPTVEYDFDDLTGADNVLTVTSPEGRFLHSGTIKVIMDYKNDEETTLAHSWHWHPFVTGVSQDWSIESGGDVVVVYGGGFCNYDTVLCSYGGLEGAQSDIAHDDRLVCMTPYHSSGPASVGVTVTFCDDQDNAVKVVDDSEIEVKEVDGQDDDRETDCDCLYMGTTDTVSAGSHKFVGISSIEPTSGPYVGGTTVTVSGLGFAMMSRVECVFGDLPAVDVTANTTSDGQVDCISPDAGDAKVVPFRLRLTYTLDDGATYTTFLPALSERPLFYEYGRPYITEISPDNQDLDEETTVTLTGRYFNGGDLANIKCHFVFVDGSEDVFTAISKTDTEVVCGPVSMFPDVETFTVAAVTVSFEDSRQSNMVSYQYTQNPTANNISPTNGGKYGGTTIEISGSNLHGGISYLCKFGNIIVGPATLSNQTITCKTPATDIDEDDLPEQVSVAFSIDGGLTFVPVSGEEYEYQDSGSFNDDGGNDDASSASSIAVSAALLIVALLAVAF